MESVSEGQIDSYDLKMLDLLEQDGRMSVTELASRVGLSKTPCQVRFKRLLERGVIRGFRAVLNHHLLNRDHVAFAEVKLEITNEEALGAFNRAVAQLPAIEACHMIAGQFDYLLKVRTRDIAEYRRVMGEQIATLPYVRSTSTYVVMESVKE
ncbi:Lrp/AsnC ligand binding domain-containing protein [Granulosicoccaceae sp. 1_MG-2023]|nr:Lrp/AsnC ligand binding domain-containing protein [Granulosicoccaceae sp. 1_MG-2023]